MNRIINQVFIGDEREEQEEDEIEETVDDESCAPEERYGKGASAIVSRVIMHLVLFVFVCCVKFS